MKKNTENKPSVRPAKVMTKLDDLQSLLEAPMKCRFKIDNQILEIEVKRMPAALAERQRAILRAVQPPFKKERNDYDMTDPDYIKKKAAAEEKTRCLAVYYCCPIISAKKTCSSDEEIVAFVAPLLTQYLQEMIAMRAEAGGLQLVNPNEVANFTGPNGSGS